MTLNTCQSHGLELGAEFVPWYDTEHLTDELWLEGSRTDEQEKIKNATKKCKEAFSKCRKFEDDAVSILKSCSESPDKLKQKAAALSKNKDALAAAKAKIAKVTGSSGRRRSRRAPANNCGEFIVLAERCKY